LTADSSVDGLRLDSALNVDVGFFTSFTKAAGVFATGEVLSGLTTDVCPYQATIGSVLNYPMYATLPSAIFAFTHVT
jgi:alpha-amylase